MSKEDLLDIAAWILACIFVVATTAHCHTTRQDLQQLRTDHEALINALSKHRQFCAEPALLPRLSLPDEGVVR